MIEKWIQEIFKSENQFIIAEISKKFSLSKEEHVNLINLMIYYYAITSNPNTLEAVTSICNKILLYKEEIEKNKTFNLFEKCLSEFLDKEESVAGNLNRIIQFLKQGFFFHSFNSAFFNQINEKGLILKEKPWSLEETIDIRNIFQQHNSQNIFGLYQSKEQTPVFFSSTLISSAYYGLSSPTFFRKFIENDSKYFNTFLNRDYNRAKESINALCTNLNPNESDSVLRFFQKYWSLFATDDLPCVAISTSEKLGIKKADTPTTKNLILKELLKTLNMMIKTDIEREALQIFDYQTFSLTPYTKEKTY